jgi:tetratricopeptide (TPR) repeat protein
MKSPQPLNKKIKSLLFMTAIVASLALGTGCSLFKRKNQGEDHAKNATPTTDPQKTPAQTAPAVPPTENPPGAPTSETLAERSYALAQAHFAQGQWAQASDAFSGFLADYPNAPINTRAAAKTMLAESLARAGRCQEALPLLRHAIEATSAHINHSNNNQNNNRAALILLTAECYSQTGATDQALAATHEIVPDAKLLARLALPPEETNKTYRKANATLALQNRALLLRARLLAERGNITSADETLLRAKRMLHTGRGYGITNSEAKALHGELNLRELEILPHRCLLQHPMPPTANESTAMEFLARYYHCVENGRVLLCDLSRMGDAEQMDQAKKAYKAFVLAPLALQKLPPSPDRRLPDESSRSFFAREWNQFVQTQVESKARDFNSIQECGLSGIF